MNKGAWYAIGAYGLWGLLPVYWKLLQHVPPMQQLGHRIVWSCLLLGGVLVSARQQKTFWETVRTPRVLAVYSVAAVLIAVNWLVYVWAVNEGHLVETSLGYFINPLVSVVLGLVVLRERLRPGQWVPLGLAAAGVAYLTWSYGRPPWIALSLAFSFGFYGLVKKKKAPLGSSFGLTLETLILFVPAVAYLAAMDRTGTGAFLHAGVGSDLLLVGAGVVTTVPLLFFASAVQRLPLSTLGLFQYLAPTLQFLLGVVVYHEPFSRDKLVGFVLVWSALVLFAAESIWARRVAGRRVVV